MYVRIHISRELCYVYVRIYVEMETERAFPYAKYGTREAIFEHIYKNASKHDTKRLIRDWQILDMQYEIEELQEHVRSYCIFEFDSQSLPSKCHQNAIWLFSDLSHHCPTANTSYFCVVVKQT